MIQKMSNSELIELVQAKYPDVQVEDVSKTLEMII